jgi:hypothetical protein
MRVLALAALVTLVVSPSLAKHAPLPEKLLTAKTIFVENHCGARLGDKAYAELTKWGRFQVVTDRAKADVVLLVSEVTDSVLDARTGDTLYSNDRDTTKKNLKDLRKRIGEQEKGRR